MTPDRMKRVEELFVAAAELATAERPAFLSRACAGDDALRAEVESLLEHDDTPRATRALVNPTDMRAVVEGLHQLALSTRSTHADPADPAAVVISDEELRLPAKLGRYTLQQEIGRGGMGIVYRAEQDNPRRIVAIKLMRPGVWSRRAQRRFEYEAQVLGRLRHHGIAQIYDADVGQLAQGGQRYYFAMELIEGRPLLAYANEHGLGVRARLELFAKVCDALQHAHQNGVIHRDLKSTNILVTSDGQPKVLDFGVARALDADQRLTTMGTDVGQLIGTLPYMSPEQVAGDPEAVDTRSDVYALGVNLYELLTGHLPHDVERKSIVDAARVIRDEEPARLSTFNRVFRGDVDTIVHKALEKTPERRYASASDLAADIRRYLAGEPIAAKRDSAWYLLHKLAARYRAALIVLALFAITVSAAAGWLAVLYSRAQGQAVELNSLYQDAQQARAQAETARHQAEAAQAESEGVLQFFREALTSADPRYEKRSDLSMREFLDRTAARIDEGKQDFSPQASATVRDTIASAYQALGRFEEAEGQARKALDARLAGDPASASVATADAQNRLAETVIQRGRPAEAEPLLRAALDTFVKRLGPDAPQVATVHTNLSALLIDLRRFDEAEASALEALRIRGLMPKPDERLMMPLNHLGLVSRNRKQYGRARDYYSQALEVLRTLGHADAPDYAQLLNNLGLTYAYEGQFEQASPYFEEALAMNRRLFGERHPAVANALNSLGGVMQSRGESQRAVELFREALDQRSQFLGPDHPNTMGSRNNLAAALERLGRHSEAEPLLREYAEFVERTRGDEPTVVADALGVLGTCLMKQERYSEAEPIMARVMELRRQHQPNTWQHGLCLAYTSELLAAAGRTDEAAEMRQQGWDMIAAAAGDTGLPRRASIERLAAFYRDRGDEAAAARWETLLPPPASAPATQP